jgi:hypothetical protein
MSALYVTLHKLEKGETGSTARVRTTRNEYGIGSE